MQLVFPGFLWGLVGISLPLLLHLLQLRRPRRIQFTNIGFIKQVELTSRYRRLQDLLTLALRISALLFLVLLFCQPFIPAKNAAVIINNNVSVLADNSLSMRVPNDEGSSLLEKDNQTVKQLVKNYSSNGHLKVIGQKSDNLTTGVAPSESESKQVHLIGWGAPLARREWEKNVGDPLYIFSDFQRSEVSQEVIKKITTGREIVLLPQVGKAVGNLYVDSVWLSDAFVRMQVPVALHIRVRNGGKVQVRDCPVKVVLGGQQQAVLRVTVAPGRSFETAVQLQLAHPQVYAGKVEVEDAPVSFDNTYYFSVKPTTAIQVVEIGSKPRGREAYQNEPLFRYSYVKPEQVNYGQLQQANLVLLTEASIIDASLRQALLAVVKRGGSVAIVPPAAQAAQNSYAQLLRDIGAGQPRWSTAVGEITRQELAAPDLKAPFFRGVFGAQQRQVALPKASPVLQLNSNGTDILRLRDGSEFLTEFTNGPGRVYVFSTPFDRTYSDFVSHAFFVPVLYRLAMLSYRDEQPLAYSIGKKTVALNVPPVEEVTSDKLTYRLVQDSLTLVPAQHQQGRQLQLEVPVELTKPGFYQIRLHDQVVAILAFNQDKKESELATYSAAEIRQLIGPNRPNVHVLEAGEPAQTLLRYRAGQTGQPLWRYCLLLALSCLLAEGLVLRWGRRIRPLQSVTAT